MGCVSRLFCVEFRTGLKNSAPGSTRTIFGTGILGLLLSIGAGAGTRLVKEERRAKVSLKRTARKVVGIFAN